MTAARIPASSPATAQRNLQAEIFDSSRASPSGRLLNGEKNYIRREVQRQQTEHKKHKGRYADGLFLCLLCSVLCLLCSCSRFITQSGCGLTSGCVPLSDETRASRLRRGGFPGETGSR